LWTPGSRPASGWRRSSPVSPIGPSSSRYENLYERRAYLKNEQTREVKDTVGELRKRYRIADRRRVPLQPAPREEQLALII
jgi:hypothetical protein